MLLITKPYTKKQQSPPSFDFLRINFLTLSVDLISKRRKNLMSRVDDSSKHFAKRVWESKEEKILPEKQLKFNKIVNRIFTSPAA